MNLQTYQRNRLAKSHLDHTGNQGKDKVVVFKNTTFRDKLDISIKICTFS